MSQLLVLAEVSLERRVSFICFELPFFFFRFVVLSAAVEDCNGMNHTDRMRYWGNLLTKSPATKFGTRVTQKHVFVGVSWTVSKLLYRSEEGQKLCQLANKMTFLINEDNHKWAGVREMLLQHSLHGLLFSFIQSRRAFDSSW